MRVLSATVENFGSYEHLEFDFTDKGLTLISGPTGAGKSTLCDIIPWILFGVTAKGGTVDEVISWTVPEGEIKRTAGRIDFEVAGNKFSVYRARGKDPRENDLKYCNATNFIAWSRGKDLNDTQKLINDLLGLTADTYLAAAYFHEFSQTAAFFTTTAKVRRQITEQLVDLSKCKKLTETMSEYRKELKTERDETTAKVSQTQVQIDLLNRNANAAEHKSVQWQEQYHDRWQVFKAKEKAFDNEQQKALAKIEAEHIERSVTLQYDITDAEKQIVPDSILAARRLELEQRRAKLEGDNCKECGAPKNVSKLMVINKDLYAVAAEKQANERWQIQLTRLSNSLQSHMKTLEPKLDAERARRNTYGEQLKAMKIEVNPHLAYAEQCYADLKVQNKEHDRLTTTAEDLTQELDDIELLLQVTQDLRGVMLKQAVSYLETQTNKMLTDHFDAEIKIEFDIADADKLDVTIYKDGNICSYTQLSKGQRQLLRLTFGLAVMKQVANSSGVKPSVVCLDEFSDSLDEQMKLKAFGLVEDFAMDYETVLAIDHNDAVKSMFTSRYDVELVNGKSEIQLV